MKHFTLKTQLFFAAFALSILVSSCSSTTLIDSYPTGAYLYLDGEAVGQTPYQMTDTKPSFSCTTVRIEKDNYAPFYTEICRDEDVDGGAIVGGCFFTIPFIWTFKYKPTHFYRLKADGTETEGATLDKMIEKEQQKEGTSEE